MVMTHPLNLPVLIVTSRAGRPNSPALARRGRR